MNKIHYEGKWNNFQSVHMVLIIHSWEHLQGMLGASDSHTPYNQFPKSLLPPQWHMIIISLGSLLIPCTHLTDISVASGEQHQIPEMWSPDQGPAVPGTVVHNGKKNAPVLFSLIGSLCWGKGKICKGFGGPTCPLSSWRETAARPQCIPSPVQVLRDLPAVPGALSQSCLEKPHRRPAHKWDIHSGRQLFLRNPSGTRVNHAKMLNPTNLNLKQNLIG